MSSRPVGRNRRRRKIVRSMKKTFINVVFAPARIPRIKGDTLELIMKMCEAAALSFAAALVLHIAVPDAVKTGVVVFCGIVFAVLLLAIKLSDYQEKIEQYRYYGFRI